MEKEIKNKVIVITGGVGGLGSTIVDNFLKNDAKVVVLVDINENLGNEVIGKLCSKYGNNKADFVKCDVTRDCDEVSRNIIDKYGYVDVLVNSVGKVDDENKTIELNLTSVVSWSYQYRDLMRKDRGGKGGTIINISSVLGYRISPYWPIYVATKFAFRGFTNSLGHSYNFERTGVRAIAMCPGFTETALAATIKCQDEGILDDILKYIKQEVVWQKADTVGRAAVEMFQRADSGSTWLIEGGNPVVEI